MVAGVVLEKKYYKDADFESDSSDNKHAEAPSKHRRLSTFSIGVMGGFSLCFVSIGQ